MTEKPYDDLSEIPVWRKCPACYSELRVFPGTRSWCEICNGIGEIRVESKE